jgi:hypothetical protein
MFGKKSCRKVVAKQSEKSQTDFFSIWFWKKISEKKLNSPGTFLASEESTTPVGVCYFVCFEGPLIILVKLCLQTFYRPINIFREQSTVHWCGHPIAPTQEARSKKLCREQCCDCVQPLQSRAPQNHRPDQLGSQNALATPWTRLVSDWGHQELCLRVLGAHVSHNSKGPQQTKWRTPNYVWSTFEEPTNPKYFFLSVFLITF